jgi:hypothetical protein
MGRCFQENSSSPVLSGKLLVSGAFWKTPRLRAILAFFYPSVTAGGPCQKSDVDTNEGTF